MRGLFMIGLYLPKLTVRTQEASRKGVRMAGTTVQTCANRRGRILCLITAVLVSGALERVSGPSLESLLSPTI